MTYDDWIKTQVGRTVNAQQREDGSTVYYTGDGEDRRKLGNEGNASSATGEDFIRNYYNKMMTPDANGMLAYGTGGTDFASQPGTGAENRAFDIGGQQWVQAGQRWSPNMKLDGMPGQAWANILRDTPFTDIYKEDPEKGPLLRKDVYDAMGKAQAATHPDNWFSDNSAFDAFGKTIGTAMGVSGAIAGGLGMAANAGYAGAGEALASSGYQSLGSSLWNGASIADGASGAGNLMGSFTDQPWGVNPQYNMSEFDPQNFTSGADNSFFNPMDAANNPYMSAAASAVAPYAGDAAYEASGLSDLSSRGAGTALNGTNSMWGNFVSNYLDPSKLFSSGNLASAAVSAGGNIFSALTGKAAAENAARIQAGSVNTANAALQPWQIAGSAAIGQLADRTIGPNADLTRKFSMSDLNADPVYNTSLKFGMDQGTQAIERKYAASGGLNSGAAAKAIAQYATDYGGQKAGESFNRYESSNQNAYNKIAGVAGVGQNAANQVGSNTIGMGNANAAASIAGSNAITGAVNNFANHYQSQQILNRQPMYSMS
jgi:hypothetical protein